MSHTVQIHMAYTQDCPQIHVPYILYTSGLKVFVLLESEIGTTIRRQGAQLLGPFFLSLCLVRAGQSHNYYVLFHEMSSELPGLTTSQSPHYYCTSHIHTHIHMQLYVYVESL